MAPKSRGFDRVVTASLSNPPKLHVCRSCRLAASRRTYATTSAAQVTIESPPVSQLTPDLPARSPIAQPKYTIKAGIVVSRPPLITPDPHPFEKAYHLYQRRLNERLVLPFTQYFYYKKGTPSFEHWRKHKTARGGVATRDVGHYNAYTKESWHDEVLVGDKSAEPDRLLETLVDEEGRASEFVGDSGLTSTAGLKRTTNADKSNDERSLERKLSRTLYLLVKEVSKDGNRWNWALPSGVLQRREGLKEAAQRILDATCGVNMNTWFVARHPIGHFVAQKAPKAEGEQLEEKENSIGLAKTVHETSEYAGEKTFFMKARIFAGQADVKQTVPKYDDFAWVTKDEVEKKVHPKYWSRIKNMLVSQ